jgi:hypothetical protein
MHSHFWPVLFLALALSLPSTTAAGQGLTPPSPAIVLPSAPTTPTESFVSTTLKPLLEQALASSQDSDSNLLTLQQRIKDDATQKTLDDAARKKEQQDSATAYSALLLRVGTLQTYFDALSSKLTDFSGSEDQKQAKALAALDDIQARAKAVELENKILKIGGSVLLVAVVVIGGYEGGKALRWW